jgi:hypothetical protein
MFHQTYCKYTYDRRDNIGIFIMDGNSKEIQSLLAAMAVATKHTICKPKPEIMPRPPLVDGVSSSKDSPSLKTCLEVTQP